MQEVKPSSCALESAVGKLRGLSQDSKALIIPLIDRLAEAEGVSHGTDFKPPLENIGHWLTKLRSERKSEGTVRLYSYLTKRFLGRLPAPNRAEIREYLARRIEETSPSSAETERKALANLFSFLHAEGMWHENPLEGVRHIGPRWGERERRCPSIEDISKVLEVGCLRVKSSRNVLVIYSVGNRRKQSMEG